MRLDRNYTEEEGGEKNDSINLERETAKRFLAPNAQASNGIVFSYQCFNKQEKIGCHCQHFGVK